jgi:hypothetical protein
MARTFMYANKEAEFPEKIWGELIKTALYILNRTEKSKEEGKSPYELWIKKKSRLKHFRIIGATSYVHMPKQRRTKMDKKAVKGYLVGYDGDERYRVLIKGTISIALSRDVVFEENPIRCAKSYDDSKSETSDSFSHKTFENTSFFYLTPLIIQSIHRIWIISTFFV